MDVAAIVSSCASADDVIECLAGEQHGHTTFTCVRRDNQDGHPYDLTVVDGPSVPPEHYEVSFSGVRLINNGQVVEAMSLGAWMRERSLFFMLRRKRLFKTWRLQKSLQGWKATVSGRRFQRRKADIQESALLAHPPYCRALHVAASLCFKLAGLAVVDCHSNGPLRLEEWVKVQTEVLKTQLQPQFLSILDKLTALMGKLHASLNVPEQSAVPDQNRNLNGNLDTWDRHHIRKAFPALLYLIQRMVAHAKVGLAVRQAQELEALLAGKATLAMVVDFAPHGLRFSPTDQHVLQVIDEEVLGALVQHLTASDCQLATPVGMDSNACHDRDRQTVGAVLDHTLEYTSHRDACHERVLESFRQVQDACRILEASRDILTRVKAMRAENFTSSNSEEMKRDLWQLREWEGEIGQMRVADVVGIFTVDSSRIQQQLKRAVVGTIVTLQERMANAAHAQSQAVVSQIRAHMRALTAESEGIEANMKWLEDLDAAQQYQAGSAAVLEDVRQLYSLGTNGRVTPEQDACLQEVEQHHQCLMEALDAATGKATATRAQLLAHVLTDDELLSAEFEGIETQLKQCNDGSMTDDLPKMTIQLDSLWGQCETLAERAQQNRRFASMVGSTTTLDMQRAESAKRIIAVLQMKRQLQHDVRQAVKTWTSMPAATLDIEKMVTQLDTFNGQLLQAERTAIDKGDHALQDIRLIIDHMYSNIPLLRALCGKKMSRNDWGEILQVLNAPPQTDQHKTSLHMLEQLGLNTHRAAVLAFVAQHAA